MSLQAKVISSNPATDNKIRTHYSTCFSLFCMYKYLSDKQLLLGKALGYKRQSQAVVLLKPYPR